MLDLSTVNTQEPSLQVTTVLEKNRVVANVTGMEDAVDAAHASGILAKTALAKWDEIKPGLRDTARKVLAQLQQDGTVVRAVMLLGTQGHVVEVCPSDKPKELVAELVNEAKFRGLEGVVIEDVEVTLTGALAQWAIKTLPLLAKQETLAGNFFVKRKNILAQEFRSVARTIKNGIIDQDLGSLLDRLQAGGYNSPAVEAKTKKNV